MATITIHNLDDSMKAALKKRAKLHNHSLEEEVRLILKRTIRTDDKSQGMGTRIHKLFVEVEGIDLPEPVRTQTPQKSEPLK